MVTSESKKPPAWTLGGRVIEENRALNGAQRRNISGIFANEGRVKFEQGLQINGHINRNIRMLLGLTQSSQPFIELLGYAEGGQGTVDGGSDTTLNEVKLYWRVVGCVNRIYGFGYKIGATEKYRY